MYKILYKDFDKTFISTTLEFVHRPSNSFDNFFHRVYTNTCFVPRYPLNVRIKDKKTSGSVKYYCVQRRLSNKSIFTVWIGRLQCIFFAKKHTVRSYIHTTQWYSIPNSVIFFFTALWIIVFYYIILEARETFYNIPFFIDIKDILLRNIYWRFFLLKNTISLDKTFIVNIL